ncbi:type VII secretion-associated serine protease mycosin [Streptomyces canus]|uniref:type VII secretion-associated serine protease mycosin n=1 Tax=Streptomyces canus TaxID=58343 RepID=UPI00278B31CF|nr:type VII secretion-associated serine protease mycosin [Streptomyces canus]MDQ1067253.1 type VII secretion-associated serine protease mycosin [Streptomyces canus]
MSFRRTLRVAGCGVAVSAVLFASAPLAAADQVRDDQWALEALNAESVWKISQGSGVIVAVIDTGVNANHIDLKGNVLNGKDFVDGGSAEPDPGQNHGTAMASIIAAHGHGANDGVIGLAPKAKILPIRDSGDVKLSETIRYAVDNGASVINVSQCFDSSDPEALEAVSDAVTYALSRDVLVVGAAGNEEDKGGKCYPAASPGALGVGAVKNDGLIWSGSNPGDFVALTAPGANIVSANAVGNGYHAANGTSDAAAYTSAAAALLRSKFPDLTAGQIANRLVKTAVMPDSEKSRSLPDQSYGYGIIQPLAALKDNIPAGSKYGPLTVPESLKGKPATSSASASDSDQEKADQKAMLIWAVIGVVGLAVIGLIVFLIVKASRRNKNNSGGPGGTATYPQYGQQPVPPHQNPYQQQAAPQQNPYQQPTPPQGQWPPQQ